MGRTVPVANQDAIDFFANRIGDWAKGPAAIGLTSSQIDEINLRLAEAQARLAEAHTARIAAQTATLALSDAMRSLRGFGGDLVKTIRAFAETTEDPGVYTASSIPPVAEPTPSGPPEQPTHLSARLLSPFGLAIAWKGSASQGTYFGVWRRLPGETSDTLIATRKTKSFEDRTLPPGTAAASYTITAHRDDETVYSSALTVQIGAGAATEIAAAA
jgi:hypothetical protein